MDVDGKMFRYFTEKHKNTEEETHVADLQYQVSLEISRLSFSLVVGQDTFRGWAVFLGVRIKDTGICCDALFSGQQLYISVDYFTQDVRPHVTAEHQCKPQAMFGKHTKTIRQRLMITFSCQFYATIVLSMKKAFHCMLYVKKRETTSVSLMGV